MRTKQPLPQNYHRISRSRSPYRSPSPTPTSSSAGGQSVILGHPPPQAVAGLPSRMPSRPISGYPFGNPYQYPYRPPSQNSSQPLSRTSSQPRRAPVADMSPPTHDYTLRIRSRPGWEDFPNCLPEGIRNTYYRRPKIDLFLQIAQKIDFQSAHTRFFDGVKSRNSLNEKYLENILAVLSKEESEGRSHEHAVPDGRGSMTLRGNRGINKQDQVQDTRGKADADLVGSAAATASRNYPARTSTPRPAPSHTDDVRVASPGGTRRPPSSHLRNASTESRAKRTRDEADAPLQVVGEPSQKRQRGEGYARSSISVPGADSDEQHDNAEKYDNAEEYHDGEEHGSGDELQNGIDDIVVHSAQNNTRNAPAAAGTPASSRCSPNQSTPVDSRFDYAGFDRMDTSVSSEDTASPTHGRTRSTQSPPSSFSVDPAWKDTLAYISLSSTNATVKSTPHVRRAHSASSASLCATTGTTNARPGPSSASSAFVTNSRAHITPSTTVGTHISRAGQDPVNSPHLTEIPCFQTTPQSGGRPSTRTPTREQAAPNQAPSRPAAEPSSTSQSTKSTSNEPEDVPVNDLGPEVTFEMAFNNFRLESRNRASIIIQLKESKRALEADSRDRTSSLTDDLATARAAEVTKKQDLNGWENIVNSQQSQNNAIFSTLSAEMNKARVAPDAAVAEVAQVEKSLAAAQAHQKYVTRRKQDIDDQLKQFKSKTYWDTKLTEMHDELLECTKDV